MGIKTYLLVSRENVLKGLDKALIDYRVAALKHKDERVLYDYISDASEIELKYHPTVLSLKKFFYPQDEVILEYTLDGKTEAKIQKEPLVLFGVRPCDLNAFKILAEDFADDNGDPNYLARWQNAIVIGIDCKKICDKYAFCYKVQTENAKGGYSVMLYEINAKNYLLETIDQKGEDFVKKYFKTEKAKGDEFAKFQKQKARGFAKEKPFKDLDKFPEIFAKSNHHPIWEQEGSRCLSCGSCIMVCPTCYCFDVKDELDLNLKKGKKIRSWDACMLDCFAVVSGGENFRHTKVGRLKHRINRKFNFLMKKHKMAVCVGCGRCVRACLVEISPKTIAAAIVNDEK
jgi:sulfhydrogenase subunit beta (sulfur reductase)